jgi:hypothetical protein
VRTYTVRVQWMGWNRRRMDYTFHSATVRGIRAASDSEARRIALAPYLDTTINPSVSCCWYDWPQPA